VAVRLSVLLVLILAQRVLHAADDVLHFAGNFFSLTFAFKLFVTQHLAGHFLHLANLLFDRTCDSIMIHAHLLLARRRLGGVPEVNDTVRGSFRCARVKRRPMR
jgi:hypothetical protein